MLCLLLLQTLLFLGHVLCAVQPASTLFYHLPTRVNDMTSNVFLDFTKAGEPAHPRLELVTSFAEEEQNVRGLFLTVQDLYCAGDAFYVEIHQRVLCMQRNKTTLLDETGVLGVTAKVPIDECFTEVPELSKGTFHISPKHFVRRKVNHVTFIPETRFTIIPYVSPYAAGSLKVFLSEQCQMDHFIVLGASLWPSKECVCAKYDAHLAMIRFHEFNHVVTVVKSCVGWIAKVQIAGYEGDTFGNQTVALAVSDDGGAVVPCNENLPVLCRLNIFI